jgi:hypothetical protein
MRGNPMLTRSTRSRGRACASAALLALGLVGCIDVSGLGSGRDLSGMAVLDATEPHDDGGTSPDLDQSDLVANDLGTADQGTGDLGTPDLALPDLAVPDLAIPDLAIPDLARTDLAPIPDLAIVDLARPDLVAPDLSMPPKVYVLRGATSGLGGGRSSGGPFVLMGAIGLPQPRVVSSGGKFTLLPLVPGPPP